MRNTSWTVLVDGRPVPMAVMGKSITRAYWTVVADRLGQVWEERAGGYNAIATASRCILRDLTVRSERIYVG